MLNRRELLKLSGATALGLLATQRAAVSADVSKRKESTPRGGGLELTPERG